MARYRQSPNYIAKKSLWPAFRWWNLIFYMILIPALLIVFQIMKVDAPVLTEFKDGDEVIIASASAGKLFSANKTNAVDNDGVDYEPTNFDNVTDNERYVIKIHSDGSCTFASKTEKVIAMGSKDAALDESGVNNKWILVPKEGADGVYYLKNANRNSYLEWDSSKSTWGTRNTSNPGEQCEISFYEADVKVKSYVETYALYIAIALYALVPLTFIGIQKKLSIWNLLIFIILLPGAMVAIRFVLPPLADMLEKLILGNGWVILGLWCLFPFMISLVKIIILKCKYIEFYDDAVIEKSGVFVKHVKKTVFPEVTAVTTQKNILGYGDVYIDVVGPWDITFDNVARPDDLRDYLVYHMLNSAAVENISNNPYIAATDGIF